MVGAACTAAVVQEHLEGSVIQRIGTGFARRRRTRPGDNGARHGRKSECYLSYYGANELPFAHGIDRRAETDSRRQRHFMGKALPADREAHFGNQGNES
jgi:hypothetical protein